MDAALTTLEQMKRAGANILGIVLNRIPRDRPSYYGGYRHYSGYYKGEYGYYDESSRSNGKYKGNGKSKFPWLGNSQKQREVKVTEEPEK